MRLLKTAGGTHRWGQILNHGDSQCNRETEPGVQRRCSMPLTALFSQRGAPGQALRARGERESPAGTGGEGPGGGGAAAPPEAARWRPRARGGAAGDPARGGGGGLKFWGVSDGST